MKNTHHTLTDATFIIQTQCIFQYNYSYNLKKTNQSKIAQKNMGTLINYRKLMKLNFNNLLKILILHDFL